MERFVKIVVGALTKALDGILLGSVAGRDQNFRIGVDGLAGLQHVQAAHARHFEVRRNEGERVFAKEGHAFFAGRRHGDVKPATTDLLSGQLANARFVIDVEMPDRRGHRVVLMSGTEHYFKESYY